MTVALRNLGVAVTKDLLHFKQGTTTIHEEGSELMAQIVNP